MARKSRLSSRPATVSDPVVGSDSDSDLPEAPSQGWDPNLPSTANNTITSQKKLPIKKRVIKSVELIELSSDDCEDNTVVSLESGDSMFSGKNKKSRITPIKPKIATPPLKTRSSSGIFKNKVIENVVSKNMKDCDKTDVKSTNQVKTSVRKSRLKRVAPIVESDSTDGIGSELEGHHTLGSPVDIQPSPKKKAKPSQQSPKNVDMMSDSDDNNRNPPLTPSRIKRMHLPKLVVLPSDLFDKLENALHNPLTPTKKNKDIGNVSLLSKPEVKSDLFDCKNEINSDEDTSFLEDEESVLADPDAVFHGQSPPRIPGKLKGKGRDRIAKQSDIAPVPAEIQEFPDLPRALMLSSEEMKAADPDEVSDFPDLARALKLSRDATFGDVSGAAIEGDNPTSSLMPMLFHQDVNGHRVQSLPSVCEVFDVSLQDKLLVSGYQGLPNLVCGFLVSWSDKRGPGQILFSAWGAHAPGMRFRSAYDSVTFTSCGRFINPSRASPLNVYAVNTHHDGTRSTLYADNTMAICVSCIYTTASFLSNAPERGIIQHYIAGIFHSQEWERFCSFLTMVFGKSELHAQLAADALSFSTKAAPKTVENNSRSPGPKGMFNQYSSPSKVRGSGHASRKPGFVKSVLEFSDRVPVYDGRKVDFDPSTHLQRIHELFPDFEGEVPQGSFSVVGYTTSVYSGKENQSHISCNVQWVIVLGTPQ